jgi:hypothetical protein
LAIAALILWVLTASAGVSLLSSGRASRGAADGPAPLADAADGPARPAAAAGGSAQTEGVAGGSAQTEGAAGGSAQTQGAAGGSAQTEGAAGGSAQTEGGTGGSAQTEGGTGGGARPAGTPVRYAAVPLTADGKPPPVPRAKVAAPPGEHPLLQFCHPALALIGFGFWLGFVLVHYRPLAWISFGVLVVTVSAGLSWLAASTLAARRRRGAARAFPPRLIVLHGLAAAATVALTVLTALFAGHG